MTTDAIPCPQRRRAMAALAAVAALPFAARTARAQARPLLVFFDWGQSKLVPSAEPLIDAIKAGLKPGARVTIAGHADTSEDNPDRLSLARAIEIQSALVKRGVPPKVVLAVVGKAAAEPMVPTGPKTREPQNRRATVTVE